VPLSNEEYARQVAGWDERERDYRERERETWVKAIEEANIEPPVEVRRKELRAENQVLSTLPPEVLTPDKGPWWHPRPRLKEKQRKYVLSRIANKRLRDLVEAAYPTPGRTDLQIRWIRETKDYINDLQRVTQDARFYRRWLRDRLKESDLATLLPGGLDSLPDIYESMGEPWASIERLFKPKDYKQLVKHVVRHLDWYLDPAQKPKPPIWQISVFVSIVVIGSVYGAIVHLDIPVLNSGYLWYILGAAFAAGLANFLAKRYAPHDAGGIKLYGFYGARHWINAAELFYYLVDSYTEPPEAAEPEFEEPTPL